MFFFVFYFSFYFVTFWVPPEINLQKKSSISLKFGKFRGNGGRAYRRNGDTEQKGKQQQQREHSTATTSKQSGIYLHIGLERPESQIH